MNHEARLTEYAEFEDLTDQVGPIDTRVHGVRLEQDGIVKGVKVENEWIRIDWKDLVGVTLTDERLEILGTD